MNSILAGDETQLTTHDIAHEATWADKYRDSDRDGAKLRYTQTRNWHFVDLELDGPDLYGACFGRPKLAPGTDAALGPANDCVVAKIDEFTAELQHLKTGAYEKRLALQFMLHFVGDLHQPLHASDDHDRGGNDKHAIGPGIRSNTLHHQWDVEFVARLGRNNAQVARRLIARITPAERARWSAGTPDEWAGETFSIGKAHAYGMLAGPTSANRYRLSASYVADATSVTAEQLSKAGVRLAALLNLSVNR